MAAKDAVLCFAWLTDVCLSQFPSPEQQSQIQGKALPRLWWCWWLIRFWVFTIFSTSFFFPAVHFLALIFIFHILTIWLSQIWYHRLSGVWINLGKQMFSTFLYWKIKLKLVVDGIVACYELFLVGPGWIWWRAAEVEVLFSMFRTGRTPWLRCLKPVELVNHAPEYRLNWFTSLIILLSWCFNRIDPIVSSLIWLGLSGSHDRKETMNQITFLKYVKF